LLGAFVFESWALYKARTEMKRQMNANDWGGYREAFRKTSDTTTLTALTEDTIALLGIVIALVGLFLEQQTGNPFFDRVSALLIGIMLMGFAVALAWENKRLLLGESLPKDEEDELRAIVADHSGVVDVLDFRTVYFGPGQVLVTGDVAFEPDLDAEAIDARITDIQDALREVNDGIDRVYLETETL
jgi:divalent metal cation (Fe/Co/Zn/Cd) transporter